MIVKKKNILPMILFHTDKNIALEIFELLDKNLSELEKEEYPFHYDILEKKKECYQKFLENREEYSSKLKIKSKDAINEKGKKCQIMIKLKKKDIFQLFLITINN